MELEENGMGPDNPRGRDILRPFLSKPVRRRRAAFVWQNRRPAPQEAERGGRDLLLPGFSFTEYPTFPGSLVKMG